VHRVAKDEYAAFERPGVRVLALADKGRETMTVDDRWGAAPDVVQNGQHEGIALLNMQTGECCELDPIGAEVWLLLCRGASLRGAVEHLVSSYDVSHERAEVDVLELINALHDLGMVERQEGAANV
jgi:hypothetical protein